MAPGAALAQGGGAFQPLPPAPPEQPAPAAPQGQQEEEDDGLNSNQQLLIGLSALVLLGGIAWAILRDARSAAPVDVRSAPGSAGGEPPQPRGSRAPASQRNRQNRAKAKAARQARKKARKR